MSYVLLTGAIVTEVIATLSLRASEGFSKPLYAVPVVAGYLGIALVIGGVVALELGGAR